MERIEIVTQLVVAMLTIEPTNLRVVTNAGRLADAIIAEDKEHKKSLPISYEPLMPR